MRITPNSRQRITALGAALAAPSCLTAVLAAISPGNTRDYVFLYLGIVAVLGVVSGLQAALIAAGLSFALVDFCFVRPVHTLDFADTTDLINLCVFFGAAGLVGTMGSRRRAAQLRAEALADALQTANIGLARLAETERQVHALTETDRLRREVLANVSHELRTPLATILTGTTALLAGNEISASVRPEVDVIAVEARRLTRLVSDIIDISRIEGGILELQTVDIDLGEAVEASAQRLRRRSPGREVQMTLSPMPLEVIADWHRLGQILDNLLDNADRVGPAETTLEIRAEWRAPADVVVRVTDFGPGIPPELRDRLFERFIRTDSSPPGAVAGMGLGLAIVRGLVSAHGGDVWVEESPGRPGATLAFSLRAASDPPEPVR